MTIIGIIASERQTNQIRKEIKADSKIELISINSKSIDNIRNVKFEIVIIHDSLEKLKEKQKHIKEILKETKYLLLNTDITINEEILKDIIVKILTYGLKQKATITVSSIGEKRMIISIQRAFKNLKGKIIEQQEIPVELGKYNTKDLYNSIIKMAIINILGVENR